MLKIPWGREFIPGDLHEVNAQVAGMFAEDQQRDGGVKHRNRHLGGALFHVSRTCISAGYVIASINEQNWMLLNFKADGRDHKYQVTAIGSMCLRAIVSQRASLSD